MVKQILYASVNALTGGRSADVPGILEESRHNNALDGITGLLWTDGARFLQVIEGDDDAVDECFARIARDRRHRAITLIAERAIKDREFGYWAMAHKRRDAVADDHDLRVRRMMRSSAPEIAAPFLHLVAARETA